LAGADAAWFPPHERITFADVVPISDYPGILGDFDIGLAPLEDTRFNASKSDLKLVEYSMIGLPVIASKVTAYVDSIRPGETGFLAKNPKDWLRHLKTLVEQPEVRSKMGAEARAWAETRVISKTIDLWLDAYDLGC
jgi:glycosyltransferase involved in cell wall biosynthesis